MNIFEALRESHERQRDLADQLLKPMETLQSAVMYFKHLKRAVRS